MSKEAGNGGLSETDVDALIATHAADDDAHHAKYTDAEADARAAALIATHAAIAGAHHAKYTDAEADARAAALIATHAADVDAHHEAQPTSHKARAHQSANQTIGNGAWTKLTLATEDYDPGSHFADSKYTVAKAGVYLIAASLLLTSQVNGAQTWLAIYKNGSPALYNIEASGGNTSVNKQMLDVVELAVDDYIEAYAYQNSGSNKDTSASMTYLAVHLISA